MNESRVSVKRGWGARPLVVALGLVASACSQGRLVEIEVPDSGEPTMMDGPQDRGDSARDDRGSGGTFAIGGSSGGGGATGVGGGGGQGVGGSGAAGNGAGGSGAAGNGAGGSGTGGSGVGGTGTAGTGAGGRGTGGGTAGTGGRGTGGMGIGGMIVGTGGAGAGGKGVGGMGVGGMGVGGMGVGGSGGTCQAPLALCGTTCVATASDPLNCGRCNNPCPTNDRCLNSVCQCVAPNILCNGVCLNPASDLHNCGACGHDCKIGVCGGGACNPVFLATPDSIGLVASDGTNVYAANNTTVYSCAISQCGNGGTLTPILTGLQFAQAILPVPAVGSLFVSEGGAGLVDNITPAGAVKFLINGGAGPGALASDGTNLYFSTGTGTSGIQRTPLAANTPTKFVSDLAGGLAYDPASSSLFARVTGGILKCPIATAVCTSFYQNANQVNDMAIAGGKLFVTVDDFLSGTGAGGGVFSCPTTGTTCVATPQVTGPAFGDEWFITADTSYFYFTSQSAANDGIYRCPFAGCNGAPMPIYADPVARSLTNDATSIYWTEGTTGLFRLAKQP